MFRAAIAVAVSVFVATLCFVAHLGTGPEPIAAEPGLVLGTGFVVFTLIAIGGLMLSRGRWTRYLTLGVIAGQFAVMLMTDLSPWSIAGSVAAGIGLTILLGPWFRGWLRLRPAADGPGPRSMALALGSVGLVPLVAIASPTEVTSWHGVLAGAGIFLAYAYSRAQVWSLWALRSVIGLAAVLAMADSPTAGAVLIGVYVAALMALAWTKEARLAVDPVYAQLPGPRVGTPRGASLGDEEEG